MIEHPLEVVNEQAEDEGIWFYAETAPEVYLMQELRRLHESVEQYFKTKGENDVQ